MIPSPAPPKSMSFAIAIVTITVTIIVTPSFSAAGIPPYSNYTVGGDSGWRFNSTTMTPGANYTSWSSPISFYLGDVLLFNSNANSTVIQTYNATTYKLCSLEQDYGKLTSQYGVEDAEDDGNPGAIPVLLKREGDNYFFSSSENGLQCRKGMRFHIVVQHGNGLPPPPPPPSPALPVSSPESTSNENGGTATRWNVAFGFWLMIWVQFA